MFVHNDERASVYAPASLSRIGLADGMKCLDSVLYAQLG